MRNLLLATAALLAISTPADAGIVFDSTMIGKDVTFNFNGFNTPEASGGIIDGLSALATFRLTSISNGAFSFAFTIDNTSAIASRVSVFGFDTQPDVANASIASAVYSQATLNGNVPNLDGSNAFRTCFSGQNCSGGGNAGITPADAPASGSFVLQVASAATALSVDRAFVRYQSLTLPGINSATGLGTITAVPEPATWAMMIGGFGLVGAVARRRVRVSGHAIA
jgi:hypothetical protein